MIGFRICHCRIQIFRGHFKLDFVWFLQIRNNPFLSLLLHNDCICKILQIRGHDQTTCRDTSNRTNIDTSDMSYDYILDFSLLVNCKLHLGMALYSQESSWHFRFLISFSFSSLLYANKCKANVKILDNWNRTPKNKHTWHPSLPQDLEFQPHNHTLLDSDTTWYSYYPL